MASIVESIAGDRRIVLGNEEFVRQMSIGTLWGKIRVGMRIAMNGSSNLTNASLCIGVCQGTSNTFSSANTTDYIGVQFAGQVAFGAVPLTYTAGPPNYYVNVGGGWTTVKRTGNTTTVVNTGVGNQCCVSASPTTNRSQIFLDIVKAASPTVKLLTPSTAQVVVDVPSGQFLFNMENEAAPTQLQTDPATGITYSGSSLWDTVSVFWNKSVPTIEISDISVIRFY